MFKIKYILIFLIISKNISAQDTKLPYQQDLNKYWELLTTYHPDENLNKLESLKNSLLVSITPKTNFLEFYQIISFLNSQLNCVHTSLSLSKKVVFNLQQKPIFLPYFFRITTDSIFILINKNYYNVLKINGEKSAIILKKMRTYLKSDDNIYYKKYVINKSFPVSYSLYINSKDTHLIKLQDSTFSIKGVVSSKISNRYKNQMKYIYYSDILESEKAAYLKVGSFDVNYLKSKKINTKKVINNFFKKIKEKNISTIVLDLRGNSGGQSGTPQLLLKYLSTKPYTFIEKIKYKKDNYVPYYNLRKRDFYKEGNYFIEKKHFEYTKQKTVNKDCFKGRVYIIINGEDVSMAVAFIKKMIDTNNNTILIGEPVGSNFNFNAGLFINEQLSNGKIKVRIPIQRMIVDSTQSNYIIVPKVEMKDNQFLDKDGKIIFSSLIYFIKQHNLWNGKP